MDSWAMSGISCVPAWMGQSKMPWAFLWRRGAYISLKSLGLVRREEQDDVFSLSKGLVQEPLIVLLRYPNAFLHASVDVLVGPRFDDKEASIYPCSSASTWARVREGQNKKAWIGQCGVGIAQSVPG